MFTKYQRSLKRLRNEREGLRLYYKKEFQKYKDAPEDIKMSFNSEARMEIDLISDALDELRTRKIVDKAYNRGLPIPERNEEFWRESSYGEGWLLTDKGFWELSKILREEQKGRWELLITVLSLVVGILALLVSLIK